LSWSPEEGRFSFQFSQLHRWLQWEMQDYG
jgi:hypothetical protein